MTILSGREKKKKSSWTSKLFPSPPGYLQPSLFWFSEQRRTILPNSVFLVHVKEWNMTGRNFRSKASIFQHVNRPRGERTGRREEIDRS